MEVALRARVVGQDHVVGAISDAVRISRAGLQAPTRPVASFLFLGPTGVGKVCAARYASSFTFSLGPLRRNYARHWRGSCSTMSTGHCETLIDFVILTIFDAYFRININMSEVSSLDSVHLDGSKNANSIMIDTLCHA
jgi:hypothetical protein